MTKIIPLKAIGSGVDANGDVTGAVVALKEYAAGDTIPVEHLGTGTPTGSTVLKGDGTWGTSISAIADLTYFNMADALNEASVTMASAPTMNIGAAAGNYIIVTGTTTITGFDTVQAGARRTLKFNSSLVLTHNATSLVLPGGADITTAEGDCFTLESEGSGNWRVVAYALANGQAITTPVSLPSQTGNAGKYLTTDGSNASWGTVSSVNQSAVAYLTSGGSTTVTGKTILAAYEQTAGGTFTTPYTTEADYVQEDATNGTDHSSGTFTLHSTAGGAADSYTKLLIHADGTNGSTEIVDQRGITPFGTHCAYFDGTAYYTVPSSYKMANGTAQNFTIEGWFRIDGGSNYRYLFDTSGATHRRAVIYPANTLYIAGAGSATSAALTNDTWYHFAMVRNAGTVTCYLNGTSFGSFADATDYSASPVFFGANVSSTEQFTGWLDEFRVSKTARYTANFTPHTAPHARDADTVYLFHFDDGHGAQALRDDSRSGVEVNNGGYLSTSQSKFGATSLRLDGGAGSYAVVSASKGRKELIIGQDDFTISLWVRLDSLAGGQILVKCASTGTYAPQISVAPSGAVNVFLSSADSSYDVAEGVTIGSMLAATWTHIQLSRSGASVYGFVGGVLGATISAGSSNLWTGGTGKIYLGSDTVGGTRATGYFDEVCIRRGYCADTASFTPPGVPYTSDDRTVLLLHFDGANGDKVTLDSSESSYGTDQFGDTTIPALSFTNSAALSSSQTRGGHATSLALNGTNQYAGVQFATPSAGHPLYFPTGGYFCVEGWFYVSTFSTTPYLITITGISAAAATQLELWANASNVTARVANTSVASVSNSMSAGWNHIAFVRESRGYVIYQNGVGSTPSSPQTNMAYANEAYTLSIGSQYNIANYLSGAVDAVRITNGKPRYTANFTPATLTQDDDTTLFWEFNGSVGQKWVKELSKNTALIAATNARTVSDGVWIAQTSTPVTNATAQYKFGSAAIYVSGSNYLPTDKFDFAGANFVVDFWIYPTTSAGGTIFGAQSDYRFQIVRTVTNRYVQINGGTGSGSWSIVTGVGTTALTLNSWNHVAVVRSGNNWYSYINGARDINTTGSGSINTVSEVYNIGKNANGTFGLTDYIDEFRVSVGTDRGWTGSTITVPTAPYGNSYVTGPYWVATKPGTSSIDLSAYSSIDSTTFTTTLQPSTTLLYLVSTDGYATALKRWNGSAWVATAYSMTWNGSTLTTSATAVQLNAVGNTQAELNTGLLAMDVSAITSLNIVAILASSNASYTPILDSIVIGTDAYAMLRPVTDYTVTKKKASGSQTLTFTRVAGGNANHVIDYIP